AWLLPWKLPWNAMTSPRPVAVLHSFIAASTALAPVGPQKCSFMRERSPGGSIESFASTNASSAGVGKSRPCVSDPEVRFVLCTREHDVATLHLSDPHTDKGQSVTVVLGGPDRVQRSPWRTDPRIPTTRCVNQPGFI